MASNGRYGALPIKCGKGDSHLCLRKTSPAGCFDLQARARALLAQPKKTRATSGRSSQPSLRFSTRHPVHRGGDQAALDGRYGPYVTDGTTNASLPER